MRACRRDTLASGSSESRSTSGKIPPSASHLPIWDSTALSMNCLPTDFPRSITNFAWALSLEPIDDERFAAALPASSGCGTCECERDPFCPSGSALNKLPVGGEECTFGRKGAPHSSQYCEPSRFSVLH